MALTGKQKLFVEYYCGISNGNATDAARRAGLGKTEGSHRELARRELTKVDIQAAIKERYRAVTMSTDECLFRLAAQARATLADVAVAVPVYEEEDGKSCPWPKRAVTHKLDLDWKLLHDTGLIHQVAEIRWTRNGPAIKLCDVQGALDKIAKALGIYKPDGSVEVVNNINLAKELERAEEMSIDELQRLHRETLNLPG